MPSQGRKTRIVMRECSGLPLAAPVRVKEGAQVKEGERYICICKEQVANTQSHPLLQNAPTTPLRSRAVELARLRRAASACMRGECDAPAAGCRGRRQAAGSRASSAPRPLRQAVELLSQVHGCHNAPRCALYRKGTAVLRQACGRRRRGGTERLWKDDEQNACQPAKGRSKPPPAYVIKARSKQ